jgi:hypothetical protein
MTTVVTESVVYIQSLVLHALLVLSIATCAMMSNALTALGSIAISVMHVLLADQQRLAGSVLVMTDTTGQTQMTAMSTAQHATALVVSVQAMYYMRPALHA